MSLIQYTYHLGIRLISELALQETGVLPMLKNIDENENDVGKGYVDVFHSAGTNVGRIELG